MNEITFTGVAIAVRDADDKHEPNPEILRRFDGHTYADERFTDYIGGPEAENALADILLPSGYLTFTYVDGADHLVVSTKYLSKRKLDDSELGLLTDLTVAQWADGIGANFACTTPFNLGVSVHCQFEIPPSVDQRERTPPAQ